MAGNCRHTVASRICAWRNTRWPPRRRRTAAFHHAATTGRESGAHCRTLPASSTPTRTDDPNPPRAQRHARCRAGGKGAGAGQRPCRVAATGKGEGVGRRVTGSIPLLRRSAHGPALRRRSPLGRTDRRLYCAAACSTPSPLTMPCRSLLLQLLSSDGRRRRGHG